MPSYPRAVLGAVALLVGVTLVVAASTSTAAFGVYNTGWDGASGLQGIAADARMESAILENASRYDTLDPNGTVAMVLSPERPYTDAETARIREYVADGGTLFVAADVSPRVANDLLAGVGAAARVDGRLLRDERRHYRGPALVRATNVSGAGITFEIDALTLNYGSAVVTDTAGTNTDDGDVTVLAATSPYAYLDTNGNGAPDDSEVLRSRPVLTRESVGTGTVYVASDPSIFINRMLERTGNHRLAWNLFVTHDRVVLDYSHAGDIPVLQRALLTLRGSPVLQALVGLAGVGLILGTTANVLPGLLGRVRRRRAGRDAGASNSVDDAPDQSVDRETLVEGLLAEHPDWDERRARRVIQETMGDDTNPRNDD